MVVIRKLPSSVHSLFLFFSVFSLLLHRISAADFTDLVYKGCADQKFQDPSGIYSQNLKSLVATLVAQSAQKVFASTTSGDGQNAIRGLYQCRGDLSNSDCYKCVSKIPDMLDKLCGQVVAARIQLSGCYLRYEIVGFKQVSGTQLLYKVCGSIQASGSGFAERRETAFGMVENGVKSGGSLFYTGSYQSLYVLGQCEGDLSSGDCGDCVKSAEDQAKYICGNSISAKVYLQKCYISYNFFPNGVPGKGESSSSSSEMGPHNTQKTVALAVGGVAALGFLIACLLFVKSVFKKRGGKY
ncbi:hypothetical protein QN277_012842 [Acacia crassicarpa]|uniref:Gnk2-homologous domain-containing protein n=1 Tax=Acacia crassicarpa TaxID=499986 RepID=A0AAE1N1L9_9FABA|nr:hypothetical protein QN277_012842 [Acacia crassicarpa]